MRRWIALAVLLGACEWSPAEVERTGLTLEEGPHLLLDDYLIERSTGVLRTINTPVRNPNIPNPLVNGPTDGSSQPYFSVLKESPNRFRIWYNVPYDDRGANLSRLGYMESTDGIHWRRPHRILTVPGDIRFGASVLPAPGGYVLGFYQSGGLTVMRSSDGLQWNPIHGREVIKSDHDIAGLTFDPVRQRYIAVLSTLRKRLIGAASHIDSRETRLSVSTDLLNWETPWDVLTPDARDEGETQFYAMDGFMVRGDMLIAMVKVLRDDLDPDGAARGNEQPRGMGWTSLAWSRDGRNWTRDRAIFLAPDPAPGTWDHGFAWVDDQIEMGDSVYLYYAGYLEGHKGDRSVNRSIGLVTIARDRYAGWEGGAAGGTLLSRLLRIRGSRITLNVDAPGGEVGIRVLGADGSEPLGQCRSIAGNHLAAEVDCEADFDQLTGPIRLELTMTNAKLYALYVEP